MASGLKTITTVVLVIAAGLLLVGGFLLKQYDAAGIPVAMAGVALTILCIPGIALIQRDRRRAALSATADEHHASPPSSGASG